MSYLNQANLTPAAGIQSLSFSEIDFVSGGGSDSGVAGRAQDLQTLGNHMMAAGAGAAFFSPPVGAAIGLWGAAVYFTGTVVLANQN